MTAALRIPDPSGLVRRHGGDPVAWRTLPGLADYVETGAAMEARVEWIIAGTAPEAVWLLEHPPLYTAGTSARPSDLLEPGRLPVFATGRGGQYTYHGPGQRIAYVMLNLAERTPDLRRYVATLEDWVIATLRRFGVAGERREDRVGVWVRRPGKAEAKIAAIGIRVRRWVTFHGIALNVDPALSDFDGIVPCGVTGLGVTSFADLGIGVTMAEVDAVLRAEFVRRFGPVEG
ncbi:MAG: lipoyl(octanoyl) transferase LipB [Bauldia sp.]|nr:lipoyl(octanoyl) transferase LipB [Bauldia sp.]